MVSVQEKGANSAASPSRENTKNREITAKEFQIISSRNSLINLNSPNVRRIKCVVPTKEITKLATTFELDKQPYMNSIVN